MNTFDEFDEQTDFSFLSLEEPAPVAVPPKKSRSVQFNGNNVGFIQICSEEQKAKIRAKLTGTTRSAVTKQKISDSLKGRVFTEEAKAKMREARKQYWQSANRDTTLYKGGSKTISTPAGIFCSRNAAAEYYGVSCRVITRWTKSNSQQFYYITKD